MGGSRNAINSWREVHHCATTTPNTKLGVVVGGEIVKSLETARLGPSDHYATFFSSVAWWWS
jgi:hypothetical protein